MTTSPKVKDHSWPPPRRYKHEVESRLAASVYELALRIIVDLDYTTQGARINDAASHALEIVARELEGSVSRDH